MDVASIQVFVPSTADLAGGVLVKAAHGAGHRDPVVGHLVLPLVDLKGEPVSVPTVRQNWY